MTRIISHGVTSVNSQSGILFFTQGVFNGSMHTIDETRRQRLTMLLEKHGSIAALNDAIGLARTDATLSQIKNRSPHHKTGKPRAMGDDLARKIEERLTLPAGWMDTPPSYAELHNDDKAAALAAMENLAHDQYATAARLLSALADTKN